MNSRHISQYFARSSNILFNYVHNKIRLAVLKKSVIWSLENVCPFFS